MAKKITKQSTLSPSGGSSLDSLYLKISSHIESARQSIQRTVDTEMVKTYWLIGRDIFKEEQRGKARAEYGSYLLKELSKRLSRNFGKGFSLSTLKEIHIFGLLTAAIFKKILQT